MGETHHPRVSHPRSPHCCACRSPSGPHCWFFCRTPLDVTSVPAAGSCLPPVMPLEVPGLLQMLGFALLSLLTASGHLENHLKNCCSFL